MLLEEQVFIGCKPCPSWGSQRELPADREFSNSYSLMCVATLSVKDFEIRIPASNTGKDHQQMTALQIPKRGVAPYFTATWVEEACFQKASKFRVWVSRRSYTKYYYTSCSVKSTHCLIWFPGVLGPWNPRMEKAVLQLRSLLLKPTTERKKRQAALGWAGHNVSSQATSTATIYAAITIPRRLGLNVLVQFLVHVFRTTSFYPLLAMSVSHGEAASHCLQTANADLLQLCRFRRSPVAPYFTATWVEEACFQKAAKAEGFQGEVTLYLHTAWFARRFGPWNSRMGPSSFSDGWSAAVLSGRIFQQCYCSGFREVWFRCNNTAEIYDLTKRQHSSQVWSSFRQVILDFWKSLRTECSRHNLPSDLSLRWFAGAK